MHTNEDHERTFERAQELVAGDSLYYPGVVTRQGAYDGESPFAVVTCNVCGGKADRPKEVRHPTSEEACRARFLEYQKQKEQSPGRHPSYCICFSCSY